MEQRTRHRREGYNFQKYTRVQIGELIDELNRIRNEIHKVHATPLTEMISPIKKIKLENLDAEETSTIIKMAELKGILKSFKN